MLPPPAGIGLTTARYVCILNLREQAATFLGPRGAISDAAKVATEEEGDHHFFAYKFASVPNSKYATLILEACLYYFCLSQTLV